MYALCNILLEIVYMYVLCNILLEIVYMYVACIGLERYWSCMHSSIEIVYMYRSRDSVHLYAYQDGVHSHVDSADTDQYSPDQGQAQTDRERVLQQKHDIRTQNHKKQPIELQLRTTGSGL